MEWAYRLAGSTRRKAGVASCKVGVGIELVVVVLRLPCEDWWGTGCSLRARGG